MRGAVMQLGKWGLLDRLAGTPPVRRTSFFYGTEEVALDIRPQHGVDARDLDPYMPASVDELRKTQVAVHYLGYYLKWTPQECYYYAAEHTAFEANYDRRGRTCHVLCDSGSTS